MHWRGNRCSVALRWRRLDGLLMASTLGTRCPVAVTLRQLGSDIAQMARRTFRKRIAVELQRANSVTYVLTGPLRELTPGTSLALGKTQNRRGSMRDDRKHIDRPGQSATCLLLLSKNSDCLSRQRASDHG